MLSNIGSLRHYCKKIKISGRASDSRKPGNTHAKPSLFRAAAGMFSLTTTKWVCGRYQVHSKPGLCLAEKSHRYTHHDPPLHTSISTPTPCHTHKHTGRRHVSWGLFVQSIPAWRFQGTLKSPPSRTSCAPPARIRWARGGGPICFITLFWFYSQYPIAAASAELWVCCCTVCMSFWSAGKPG